MIPLPVNPYYFIHHSLPPNLFNLYCNFLTFFRCVRLSALSILFSPRINWISFLILAVLTVFWLLRMYQSVLYAFLWFIHTTSSVACNKAFSSSLIALD